MSKILILYKYYQATTLTEEILTINSKIMKNRFIKIYHKINTLFFTLVLIFVFSSCDDELKLRKRITNKEDLPNISIINTQMTYSKNGILEGRLTTQEMNAYEDVASPNYEFPKGIYVEIYGKDRKVESSIKANYAIYFKDKRLWEARGNVELTNLGGDTLRTEQLFGDEVADKVFTQKHVVISDADGTVIRGSKGFESNTSFSIYKFLNVSGNINVHDEFINKDSVKNVK